MAQLPPAPPWPPCDPAISAAVAKAMSDGSWGQYEGPHSELLRTQLSDRWAVDHAILCSSGTIAVELALRGLRVQGGEVILAGYDFPGNFRAIEAVGATPVLVDLTPGRYTLDVQQLEAGASPQTEAIIVSHLHGHLAPMGPIMRWAAAKGVPVVEDTCQSPGATIDGRQVGAWGDVATLSFGGSKLLTAGRGGAVLTRDASIAQRIKIFSERGNQDYPLSELQAAALGPQLERLDERNQRRSEALEMLQALLADLDAAPMDMPLVHGATFRVAWQSTTRDADVQALRALGAPVGAGFRGFAKRRRRCRAVGSLAHCEQAANRTLLLHHAALTPELNYLELLAQALAQTGLGRTEFA